MKARIKVPVATSSENALSNGLRTGLMSFSMKIPVVFASAGSGNACTTRKSKVVDKTMPVGYISLDFK